MHVYVYPRPEMESVGVAVGVNYGSIDDRKEINGAAHYLEHMLFKGTTRRTAYDIKQEVRDIGVSWNAFTTFETTIYYLQGYSGYFERMIDIISDMTTNSTLPQKEFELERGPVINEKLMHRDNPRFFFYDSFGKVLYKKHPAMRPVGGSRESIERTTRGDLLGIYNSYYTPKNMLVAIYGNVDVEKARKEISNRFGNFNRKHVPLRRRISNEPQTLNERVIKRENLKQARIGVGFKCLPFKNSSVEEFLSMQVISKMLSYRLFDEVRDKNGLSYDPSASYYPFSTFSFIGAQAGVEPKKIDDVKEIILGEFSRLEKGEAQRSEVERAASGLSIQYRMQREGTLDMANAIASYAMLTGDYRFLELLPGRIARVSLANVKKYAKKYLRTGRQGVVVLKPA